jgi:Domain of unknown function (DUF4136)
MSSYAPTILGLAAITALGCAPAIHVKTAAAPDANFSTDHTFRFLHFHSTVQPVSNPAQSNNPMFENSITGQEVHRDIADELTRRGYEHVRGGDTATSDLAIAYYIGTRQKLEVTNYDYGYPFWGWRGWRWGGGWGAWPQQQLTTYDQGTVIIDILDSSGKKLLWRGESRSEVPSDPNDYAKELSKAVHAILAEFPGRAG